MNPQQVIDIFKRSGALSEVTGEELLTEATNTGRQIDEIMEEQGIADHLSFARIMASELGVDAMDLAGFEPTPALLQLIPAGMARLHEVIPVSAAGNHLTVALANPLDIQALEDIRFSLNREILQVVAARKQVEELIKKHYGSEDTSMEDVLGQLRNTGVITLESEEEFNAAAAVAEANSTPIIRYVDLILDRAVQAQASDIHFEPFEKEFKIRYRVDGALYEMEPPPRHLALPVISRVKVMANLNIAERRVPQDGRIQRQIQGKTVDLRVSTLPTQFGESVVLRVLDRSAVQLDLETLQMPPDVHEYILEAIEKPNGIFIVTGPTGSGKTTTLYACLNKINTIDSKLLTAEDPVEYEIDGIMQVPINEAIGLTFSRVLRAFLRQDPDRIMIGETRDLETAQIAIQASLTGHLVFTTLHTNDSTGAISRLVDMGVEPFMISASLEGVLAQRLVRRICSKCKVSYEPDEALLSQLGLSPYDIGDKTFYFGKGCPECNHTGYKGRKGLYELLKISDPIRALINERAPNVVMRQKAMELGMSTLRADGLRCIFEGITTIDEVLKYT
ncbi:MAG: type II/IV secretion system protein [Verrucomicrobia bacterium]|jgi:type IV pilus assembly protein PilB|nr:MAG: type II/IV secretion system protein [Verrucomicrobiota bacterium]